MADERDDRIRELERQLRWAREDNERLLKLVDDAVAQVREVNQRNAALTQQRVDEAHERTLECEQRLAAAVLNARAPDEKLH
jgi:hypothetical protein